MEVRHVCLGKVLESSAAPRRAKLPSTALLVGALACSEQLGHVKILDADKSAGVDCGLRYALRAPAD